MEQYILESLLDALEVAFGIGVFYLISKIVQIPGERRRKKLYQEINRQLGSFEIDEEFTRRRTKKQSGKVRSGTKTQSKKTRNKS